VNEVKNLFVLSAYTAKFNGDIYMSLIGACLGIAVTFIFGSATLAWIFVGALALDFITGICKSLKCGVPITSIRIRDMFFKWMAYLSVLLVGATLSVFTGQVWIHGAALGWVIMSEGISILENCEAIIGRKIPFLDRLRRMMKAVGASNDTCDNSESSELQDS
jgi:phage-related holin